jgi:hypothetical protein
LALDNKPRVGYSGLREEINMSNEIIAFGVVKDSGLFRLVALYDTPDEAQKARETYARTQPETNFYISEYDKESLNSLAIQLESVEFLARRLGRIAFERHSNMGGTRSGQSSCRGGAELHDQSINTKGFCDYCGRTY